MDPRTLPVSRRIALLVDALDGAVKTNKALATCADGDEMVDILLGASAKLGLGLTRRDLTETPPIRDWIWFKNNEPLVTVGDSRPRYRQEKEKPSQAEPVNQGQDQPQPQRKRFLGLF